MRIRTKHIIIFLTVIGTVIFSYLYIDKPLAYYFHDHDSEWERFISSLSFLGKSHWYMVPSILLYFLFRHLHKSRYAQMALYVFVTNIAAGIAVWLLKIPFGRMRPKLLFANGDYGFAGLGIHYAYVSFPSGHSATVFTTATALALLFPRLSIPLFLFAATVAFSRVTVGAHYFSDVVMGSYLGIIVAVVLYRKMILEKQFVQNS